MTKNQKIAVIGAGYWGKNLLRVFNQLGVLNAICDHDPQRRKEAGKEYPRARITASFKDILADPRINGVVIATPAETHYQLAKAALLAGKDVFVEKPLALTITEGEALAGLAQKNSRILMVGHLLEYHPAVKKLKGLIEKGALGKIQYVYSTRLNLGKIRREENILWSFAPHDISIILLLLDELPESVSVSGGNYLHRDIADVTLSDLNFASGVKGHIFVSWLHPYKEQKLVVVGEKKMAVFDDTSPKDKLLLYRHRIRWINHLPVATKKAGQPVDFKMEEPLLAEARHFLESLKKRRTPQTDAKSALKVLRVLDACQRSLENGGAGVSLKKTGELEKGYYAHPSACIEEPSRIGKGTRIWHYSHILPGSLIGENCVIGQNVSIGPDAVIGNGCKIQNNVSVYKGVTLEDGVFCGPSCVFTNVYNPRAFIERKDEFRRTQVKKGVSIGANATIVCGAKIGSYAFIGAGAVVKKDVPDYALVVGVPARQIGWTCKCAATLKKSTGAEFFCPSCGNKYRISGKKLLPLPK